MIPRRYRLYAKVAIVFNVGWLAALVASGEKVW